MFQILKTILSSGSSISLSITANSDESLSVIVVPKGSSGTMAMPLVLTGTAAELDEGFAEAISTFGEARKSLAEQIEVTTSLLAAAEQDSAKQAVSAITKKPSSASTVKDKSSQSAPELDASDDDNDDTSPEAAQAAAAPEASAGLRNLFAD